ncbi:bifunctional DNA primase/polymerase [Streptomyces sp. FIT100]|uniref:bifunctional DNA primase/polymerase n=1 Tax=Streptomyces sp. FIT100 TaxID=2837956 RepID=UPI0021C93D1E|nr:bifunctional DNA primase/polymerase [Streptomyces sp. FIT100]UUN27922.1 bifunctional DNA primase/polymerase [Streptomyces sp. FIT100]
MAITDRHSTTLALAHALSAAERGLPVIPLSPTKLPALPSPHRRDPEPVLCRGECGLPGHGVYDATTDPTAVRALFAAAPWATGYGIACGRPPHHLIGIDLDTKSAGPGGGTAAGAGGPDSVAALQQLALQHLFTVPETVTVLTPSGGRHLWLTGPPDVVVPNSASRLAPGIDIRGSGGYLVGPGSVSAHGAYRLAPGTAHLPLAPCPHALLRLIAPSAPSAHPVHPVHPPAEDRMGRADRVDRGDGADRAPRGEGLVHFVRAAHEGQRNTRLFWAACRAYENGFGDVLVDELVAAALSTGLTEREARATIASAARLNAGRRG